VIHGQYLNNHDDRKIDTHYHSRVNVLFENGARLELSGQENYEYLFYDWSVRPGFIIPRGGHNLSEYSVKFATSRKDAVSGDVTVGGGKYYTGDKYKAQAKFDVKAFNRFRGSVEYEYNYVDLPEGKFHTNAIGTRLSYSFNPDLYIKAYIQLLDDKLLNSNKNVVSSNILFHYIYKPGSDFYVVFNESRMLGSGSEIIDNRAILTKFTYFFRR